MEVKQAVKEAKKYIQELFGEEEILNLGLEEVELDEEGIWRVTVGFSRPWEQSVDNVLRAGNARAYKMVLIRDRDRSVLSVKNRISAEL